MKVAARLSLVLSLWAACLLQSGMRAAEKKGKDADKKPESTKDVLVEDELRNADLKDKILQQSFCKTYTFKMEKDKTYHLELTSAAFPAHLRLENCAGASVGQDSSRFGAATIVHRPAKTEDHTIVATTQNGGAVGKYTLSIKEVKDWDGKPIELKNNKGQASHTGPLLTTDPLRNGKRHRVFLFEMQKGKTYQIDMTSKAFDSYLFLESPGGQQLAADDDGGGYPSARITHTAAESGKFRVITTYFGAAAGTFNLTIREK